MAAKKKSTRKTAPTPKSSKPITARPANKAARDPRVVPAENKAAPLELSDSRTVPFPVVGIGASAGGLEAFTEFLRAIGPKGGMAFVVVSHLDPDHKSALTEILSHVTPMPVSEVSDGTELLADHVYVIPPNMNMVVEGDRLRLAPRGDTRGPHMSIDVFLRSLAIARKTRAVGVILSGTATDGTLGLKAIKGEGGITFAQDDTAKHNGMPRSAVNAGCVDFVL
ncbi:MAG TPA: chemotaxis protein CheB, partial [Planctomycetaceae bacterium]|nr:chemotaxis protein CheB [Planctomycetaceae bacterium]